jgi:hypothetical protein
MKYYVINEDELVESKLKNYWYYDRGQQDKENAAKKVVTDFLKSKKPIEEIASGEVSEINFDSCIIGKENDYAKFDNIFRYLKGKSIKIFIQEL